MWTAGSGTDASPYFRIFNPITQGERFDPDGDYVRRWVPELAEVGGQGRAPAVEAARRHPGGLSGADEVDHKAERQDALARYDQVQGRPALSASRQRTRAAVRSTELRYTRADSSTIPARAASASR